MTETGGVGWGWGWWWKKDANSPPIKLSFVYTTADKKEPDFGIKRLKQKLPR